MILRFSLALIVLAVVATIFFLWVVPFFKRLFVEYKDAYLTIDKVLEKPEEKRPGFVKELVKMTKKKVTKRKRVKL